MLSSISEAYKQIAKSFSYKPEDVVMSMWIKRFLWSVCFVACFYAYHIGSFNGMAMLMAMTGIWSLNNVITRRKIMFYLDVTCVTVSLCIVDSLFLSGELSFMGPFMCLLIALISIFILGLLWGNIIGIVNCVFVSVVLHIQSFSWIRESYSDTFCEHFPYIMVAFFAAAVFLQYGITGYVLAKKGYREQLAEMIEEGKGERRKISLNLLVAMYKALCTKSPEVGEHCEMTAKWAGKIAGAAGVTGRDNSHMYYAGLLHDIGKIGTINTYWRKPKMGKAYKEEYLKHIETGYQIVYKLELPEISDATLYHHENFDGSGYKGLKEENIPLAAGIVAVANEIAHLEHDRCDYDEIITSITKQAGKKFNPAIVEAAVTALKQRIREKEEEAIFGKVE